MKHAQLITRQHNALREIDIETAEATAKLFNAGKIVLDLLLFLTSPKPKSKVSPASIKEKIPSKKKNNGGQTQAESSKVALKGPKHTVSAAELKDLGPIVEHRREKASPKKGVYAGPTGDSNTAEEALAVIEVQSEELVTARGPAIVPTELELLNGSMNRCQADQKAKTQRLKAPKETLPAMVAWPEESGTPEQTAKQRKAHKKFLAKEKKRFERHIPDLGVIPDENGPGNISPAQEPALEEEPVSISTKKQELFVQSIPTSEQEETFQALRFQDQEDNEYKSNLSPVPPKSSSENALILQKKIPEDILPEPQELPVQLSPKFKQEEAFQALHSENQEDTGHESGLSPGTLKSHSEDGLTLQQESPEAMFAPQEAVLREGVSSQYYTSEEHVYVQNFDRTSNASSEDELFPGSSPKNAGNDPFGTAMRAGAIYGGGTRGLMWAYASFTEVDEALRNAGIWLWEKPLTYYQPRTPLPTKHSDASVLATVVVSHDSSGTDEPVVEFDGDKIHIVPHSEPWDDVRSFITHPDFLVASKLVEYQACEYAGYKVWRHDREVLGCRRSGCDARLSDHGDSSIICSGCGPKTVVRYCSFQHQFEDIEEHWRECGNARLVIECVIDHTTTPSNFFRMCPAIKQRRGAGSAALHRQRIFSFISCGHYTLFDLSSAPQKSTALFWPKEHTSWKGMDQRIERLLNIASFDTGNQRILSYLYRLLRELLRLRGVWFGYTENLLRGQFAVEFGFDPPRISNDSPCECEWQGQDFNPKSYHMTACWFRTTKSGSPRVFCRAGIRDMVQEYEKRFWILRAWRQQHPTERDWRMRAAGYRFPGVKPGEDCYEMGPGWTGWGGQDDNICGELRASGTRRKK